MQTIVHCQCRNLHFWVYTIHYILCVYKKLLKADCLFIKYFFINNFYSYNAVEKFRPGKHRNHSDFPEGDLDESRVTDRVNMTTSRFYHGNVSTEMAGYRIYCMLCLMWLKEWCDLQYFAIFGKFYWYLVKQNWEEKKILEIRMYVKLCCGVMFFTIKQNVKIKVLSILPVWICLWFIAKFPLSKE